MKRRGHKLVSSREQAVQGIALVALLALAGLALIGPSGLLAWGEQASLLEERKGRIAKLEAERDEIALRVAALDPDHADPDMVGEMLKRNLQVARDDEVILVLEPESGRQP